MAHGQSSLYVPAMTKNPLAVAAAAVPPVTFPVALPPDLAARFEGREKRRLAPVFGLKNFGVNLTRILPGGSSSFRHAHPKQDEFVYILQGRPTLITDEGETQLEAGMCAGFPAGTGNAHCLVNNSDAEVVYLEIGDSTPEDAVAYPDDDLKWERGADGQGHYYRKDGTLIY